MSSMLNSSKINLIIYNVKIILLLFFISSICSSAAASIRTEGLVAYYKMENVTQGLEDELGSHDGVIDPSVAITNGKHGYAMVFDGTSSFARANTINVTNNMAISCWVKFDVVAQWDPIAIITGGITDSGLGVTVGYRYPTKVYPTKSHALSDGGYYIQDGLDDGFAPVTGQWYHFLVQKNAAGNHELWVDGVLFQEFAASAGYATRRSGSVGLTMGKNFYDDAFEGAIDTVRIYNLATEGPLSQEEIEALASEPDTVSPTVKFFANKTSVDAGNPVTLAWEVGNSANIDIDQGIGTVVSQDSIVVYPNQTTTYTLTASNPEIQLQKQVTVTVGGAFRTQGLVAHYKMESAVSGLIDELGQHDGILDGSVTTVTGQEGQALAFNGTSSFARADTISVTNNMALSCWVKFDEIAQWDPIAMISGGTTNSGLGVTVGYRYPTKVYPTKSHSLSYGGYYLQDGLDDGFAPVTGQWYHFLVQKNASGNHELWVDGIQFQEFAASAGYAKSRAGSVGLNMGKNYYGHYFKGAIDTVHIYDLSTQGPLSQGEIQTLYSGSSAAPSVDVNFDASAPTINATESTTLSWDVVNADTIAIDNGIGTVAFFGSVEVSPSETTTYTLTATGAAGTTTQIITITVDHPPVNVSIDSFPESIHVGESATLTWSSEYATEISINNGVGPVDAAGATTVTPLDTTTYTITASNLENTSTNSITIEVIAPENAGLGISNDSSWSSDPAVSNPGFIANSVSIDEGNVVEIREDLFFNSPSGMGLSFGAVYNSRSHTQGLNGYGWTHTYEMVLTPTVTVGNETLLSIKDITGKTRYFINDGSGSFIGKYGEKSTISLESGVYTWYKTDGTTVGFNLTGQLTWLKDANDNTIQITRNTQGLVSNVSDQASGRSLSFVYNTDDLIDHVIGPVTVSVATGIWAQYGYDANKNLISVTYADGSGYTYLYEDASDIHNLTKVKNKSDHVLSEWGYDSDDLVTLSNSYKDGPSQRVTFNYLSDTSVQVTDAYNVSRTYTFGFVNGKKLLSSIQGNGWTVYDNAGITRWEYDASGNLTEIEYKNGRIDQFQNYTSKGNPGIVKIAVGTTSERTLTYVWHPQVQNPLSITESSVLGAGNKITVWDYDDDGNTTSNENPTLKVSRVIQQGHTYDQNASVISYEDINKLTYTAKGQISSIDGPLIGTNDTTQFSYDPVTGDPLSITQPLIGATAFSNYDNAGQPGKVTDVNGQYQDFSYDGRGRVTTIFNGADSSSRSIIYNIAGLLSSTTDEDNVSKSFGYESVYGYLDTITDGLGQYIKYSYDSKGALIEIGTYDNLDVLYKKDRWDFNHPTLPGKLYKTIQGDDTFSQYDYNSSGNLVSNTDFNGNTTSYESDLLNQVTKITDPAGGVTLKTFDIHGNLSSVTDAENQQTVYTYDDRGKVVAINSPDSGLTTYSYDQAGNIATKTDAKGNTISYFHDELNRMTSVNHTDSLQDVSFSYDQGINGIGRQTGMTDPSGSTSYAYNSRGRFSQKSMTVQGENYSFNKTYSAAGRADQIIYPSGRTIDLTRNVLGRMSGATTTHLGVTTTLSSNVSQLPFGKADGMETGPLDLVMNQFDANGRMVVSNPGASKEKTYTYDNNGNLASITDTNNDRHSQTFDYDALNRLTKATGPYGKYSYTYNMVGNRTVHKDTFYAQSYEYSPGSNKLTEIKDYNAALITYDLNGNPLTKGNLSFTFNEDNRLIRVEESGNTLGEYEYNGLSQRVSKTVSGTTVVFHYDDKGRLIAESDPNGTIKTEYLYAGASLLAMVNEATNQIYFYQNDHLGTPKLLVDSTNTVVWETFSEPFGKAVVNPLSTITNNIRFPGQYFDAETGLHYNWHRYYDPTTGRYLTPDPIGLAGGINPFVYGLNNPINYTDRYGLFVDGGLISAPVTYWVISGLFAIGTAYYAQKVIEDLNKRKKSNSCENFSPPSPGMDPDDQDNYENPGHHDPSNNGPNAYNPNKSVLPKNHQQLWNRSRLASDGNRWTRVGDGRKAVYHRFQNDGNGNWHWNGSTNGITKHGVQRPIRPNNVPNEVTRWR